MLKYVIHAKGNVALTDRDILGIFNLGCGFSDYDAVNPGNLAIYDDLDRSDNVIWNKARRFYSERITDDNWPSLVILSEVMQPAGWPKRLSVMGNISATMFMLHDGDLYDPAYTIPLPRGFNIQIKWKKDENHELFSTRLFGGVDTEERALLQISRRR